MGAADRWRKSRGIEPVSTPGESASARWSKLRGIETPVAAPPVPVRTSVRPMGNIADYAQSPAGAIRSEDFDTKLSPDEETVFQQWKQRYAPNDSGFDYDFRGAFRAGLTPGPNGHWSDQFKKPNHETFSVESIYASRHPKLAGRWNGETFIPPAPPDATSYGGVEDVRELPSPDAVAMARQAEFVNQQPPRVQANITGANQPRPISQAEIEATEFLGPIADAVALPVYIGEAITGRRLPGIDGGLSRRPGQPIGSLAREELPEPQTTGEAIRRGAEGMAGTAVSFANPISDLTGGSLVNIPLAASKLGGRIAGAVVPAVPKVLSHMAGGLAGYTAAQELPEMISGRRNPTSVASAPFRAAADAPGQLVAAGEAVMPGLEPAERLAKFREAEPLVVMGAMGAASRPGLAGRIRERIRGARSPDSAAPTKVEARRMLPEPPYRTGPRPVVDPRWMLDENMPMVTPAPPGRPQLPAPPPSFVTPPPVRPALPAPREPITTPIDQSRPQLPTPKYLPTEYGGRDSVVPPRSEPKVLRIIEQPDRLAPAEPREPIAGKPIEGARFEPSQPVRTPPINETLGVPPNITPAGFALTDRQRAFIENRVAELGNYEAVDQSYQAGSPVGDYARDVAGRMYAQSGRPEPSATPRRRSARLPDSQNMAARPGAAVDTAAQPPAVFSKGEPRDNQAASIPSRVQEPQVPAEVAPPVSAGQGDQGVAEARRTGPLSREAARRTVENLPNLDEKRRQTFLDEIERYGDERTLSSIVDEATTEASVPRESRADRIRRGIREAMNKGEQNVTQRGQGSGERPGSLPGDAAATEGGSGVRRESPAARIRRRIRADLSAGHRAGEGGVRPVEPRLIGEPPADRSVLFEWQRKAVDSGVVGDIEAAIRKSDAAVTDGELRVSHGRDNTGKRYSKGQIHAIKQAVENSRARSALMRFELERIQRAKENQGGEIHSEEAGRDAGETFEREIQGNAEGESTAAAETDPGERGVSVSEAPDAPAAGIEVRGSRADDVSPSGSDLQQSEGARAESGVIADLFDRATKDRRFKSDVSVGRVAPDAGEQIRRSTGVEVDGFDHVIDADTVRHLINRHATGDMPITRADVLRLPDVLHNFDSVEKSPNKTKRPALDALVFKKRVNGVLYVVDAIHQKRGKLVVKTMYKKKAGTAAVSPGAPEAVPLTSAEGTNPTAPLSGSAESIARPEGDFKPQNPHEFKPGDRISDVHKGTLYQVVEADKRGMAKLRNLETGKVEDWNAYNNKRFAPAPEGPGARVVPPGPGAPGMLFGSESGKPIGPKLRDAIASGFARGMRALGLEQSATRLVRQAPSAGQKILDRIRHAYAKQARFAGLWKDEIRDVWKGTTLEDANNAVMSYDGREQPKSTGARDAMARLAQFDRRFRQALRDAGIRMLDRSTFRGLDRYMPQRWNEQAARDMNRGRGPFYDKAVKFLTQQFDSRGLKYVNETVSNRSAGERFTPDQVRGQVERFLRDRRMAYSRRFTRPAPDARTYEAEYVDLVTDMLQAFGKEYRRGAVIDNESPGTREELRKQAVEFIRDAAKLEEVTGGVSFDDLLKAGIVRDIQLHRLFQWPREFLVGDLREAWFDHIDAASKVVARQSAFGFNANVLNALARRYVNEVGERTAVEGKKNPREEMARAEDFLRQFTSDILGQRDPRDRQFEAEAPTLARVIPVARSAAAIAQIGPGSTYSAGGNILLGFFTNAYRHGLASTARGVARMYADEGTSLKRGLTPRPSRTVERAGGYSFEFVPDMLEKSNLPKRAASLLSGWYRAQEAIIRSAAGLGGLDRAKRVVKRLWASPEIDPIESRYGRELSDFGLTEQQIRNAVKAGELPKDLENSVIRAAVENSQPMSRPMDSPQWWSGPYGRLITQYWPAWYQTAQNTIGHALREAGHANLIPIARLIPLAVAAGWSYQSLGNLISGREPPKGEREKLSRLLMIVTNPLGLDTPFKVLGPGRNSGLVQALTPAALSLADGLIANAADAFWRASTGEGGKARSALRRALRSIAAYRAGETIYRKAVGE